MIVSEWWHIDHIHSEILEKNYSDIEPDMQIVKSTYSLISVGTERLVAKGLVPDALKETMRVPFMQGSFDFPLKYGYSLVGIVIKGKPSLVGKTVHLMHPHQNFAIVPAEHLTIVPDSVPSQRAVLASNMETAVNAIWDSGISFGERIIICGFGVIGASIAILASQIPSTRVVIHETNPNRKNVALSMGFELFDTRNSGTQLFDVAFNTSASGEALQVCIDNTMPKSKIIEVSWYGINSVNVSLGGSFHTGQKQIVSSQVSNISENKQSHFNHLRRKQVVFDLLQNSIFDQLPFHFVDFKQLPNVFEQLRNDSYDQFATIVKY
jgi:threonine dehydrogenase-like Zn-dependent dehydrogenase